MTFPEKYRKLIIGGSGKIDVGVYSWEVLKVSVRN